jgi:hypothetical protein
MAIATAQTTQKPTAAKKASAVKWSVMDLNSKDPHKPRIHSPGNDQYDVPINYEFPMGKKVEMEIRHALKFLSASGFKVWDDAGNLQEQTMRPGASAGPGMTLKPHQVVATYAELSMDALVARCKQLPQGRDFHNRMARQQLIDFLMNGALPALQAVADPDGADGGSEIEDGGDDDGDAGLANGILGS